MDAGSRDGREACELEDLQHLHWAPNTLSAVSLPAALRWGLVLLILDTEKLRPRNVTYPRSHKLGASALESEPSP